MNLLEEYVRMINPTTVIDGIALPLDQHTFRVKFDFRPFRHITNEYSNEHTFLRRVKQMPKEEYFSEVARMREDIRKLFEDKELLKTFILNAPKKKDGTFINGRILMKIPYPNTAKMKRYYAGVKDWSYYVLKVRTTGHNEITVCPEKEIG